MMKGALFSLVRVVVSAGRALRTEIVHVVLSDCTVCHVSRRPVEHTHTHRTPQFYYVPEAVRVSDRIHNVLISSLLTATPPQWYPPACVLVLCHRLAYSHPRLPFRRYTFSLLQRRAALVRPPNISQTLRGLRSCPCPSALSRGARLRRRIDVASHIGSLRPRQANRTKAILLSPDPNCAALCCVCADPPGQISPHAVSFL